MLLDENTLRLTVVDEEGKEELVYYNLTVPEERVAAIQTLLTQMEAYAELIGDLSDELNEYHKLETLN